MSGRSLQHRLLGAGLAALTVALVLAGFGLTWLFERHVERRAITEAETQLKMLIAGASLDGDRLTVVPPPADPRFNAAYSGLYWQISPPTGAALRSRSLWDVELSLPQDEPGTGLHVHDVKGPRGARLLVAERRLVLSGTPYRAAVALDRAEISAARDSFAADLALALLLLGLALGAAFWAQVRIGLEPLRAVRDSLAAIRAGRLQRLPSHFPAEVMPLAQEVNLLLDGRDADLVRARGRAADLAHGLKTPLTALAADVAALRAAGFSEGAERIGALGALMTRHVERQLARARLGGPTSGAATPLRAVAESIAATLARTPLAENKAFDLDVEADVSVRIERADLEEVIGNLFDNALRHARSTVALSYECGDGGSVITIGDDGPGLTPDRREQLFERGARLDERGGAGLGLSLVREVIEAYGGTVTLGEAAEGGLAVIIRLPS